MAHAHRRQQLDAASGMSPSLKNGVEKVASVPATT